MRWIPIEFCDFHGGWRSWVRRWIVFPPLLANSNQPVLPCVDGLAAGRVSTGTITFFHRLFVLSASSIWQLAQL
ncbi:unnamed protein product [Linum trigynum]|uniref:Uncharacterized protein n=1 Tax=Linum trigynum TaxID=586398 RepID=A0AAV2FMJ2_9ROSI